jgi:ribosomal protein S14
MAPLTGWNNRDLRGDRTCPRCGSGRGVLNRAMNGLCPIEFRATNLALARPSSSLNISEASPRE